MDDGHTPSLRAQARRVILRASEVSRPARKPSQSSCAQAKSVILRAVAGSMRANETVSGRVPRPETARRMTRAVGEAMSPFVDRDKERRHPNATFASGRTARVPAGRGHRRASTARRFQHPPTNSWTSSPANVVCRHAMRGTARRGGLFCEVKEEPRRRPAGDTNKTSSPGESCLPQRASQGAYRLSSRLPGHPLTVPACSSPVRSPSRRRTLLKPWTAFAVERAGCRAAAAGKVRAGRPQGRALTHLRLADAGVLYCKP